MNKTNKAFNGGGEPKSAFLFEDNGEAVEVFLTSDHKYLYIVARRVEESGYMDYRMPIGRPTPTIKRKKETR